MQRRTEPMLRPSLSSVSLSYVGALLHHGAPLVHHIRNGELLEAGLVVPEGGIEYIRAERIALGLPEWRRDHVRHDAGRRLRRDGRRRGGMRPGLRVLDARRGEARE